MIPTRLRSRNGRSARERGATMVEYALIVGLILVVSITAISKVQTNGKSRLAASDSRISTGTDNQYYSSSGTVPPVSSTTSTTSASIAVHLGSSPTINVQNAQGNKWTVTVTFTLLDGSNNGVIGARLDGSFSDGTGQPTAVNCTTSTSSGLCTVQFNGINDNRTSVTFAASSISGGTFSWQPQGAGEGNLTIPCSPPLNSSCN